MKRTIAEHNAMASVYDNPAYLADLDADIAKSQSSQAFVALAPDAKNTVGFVSHDWPECEVSEIPPNAGNDRAASFSPIAQTNLPKPTNLLKPTAPAKINKPSKVSPKRPIPSDEANDPRPKIEIRPGELDRIVNDMERELSKADGYYNRGNLIASVVHDLMTPACI